MKHATPFVISEFTNPSGDTVCRVCGWLDGKRIRKNFRTRAEAEAERQVLEVRRVQSETGLRPTVTRLTEDQLHEAESLFHKLADLPRPLSFYVEFALNNHHEATNQKSFADAIADYLAAKQNELEQDLISQMHLTRIRREMKRLLRHFPKTSLCELAGARLREYIELGGVGFKTYNNRRGILGTFFKFSLEREWIGRNPLAKIPARRIRRKRRGAATLTATQAREMMAFVEQDYPAAVPFFALCLFAGIRPCLRSGEILRLRPEHVKLEADIIRIDGEVSKVREPRRITIQPNLAAWLRAYPLDKYPIIPTNLQHIREKVVEKFSLSHDIMRHTFISMFVAQFRSVGEAALQAGNSEAIVRKHYLDLKSPEEAEAFFDIRPKNVPTLTGNEQARASGRNSIAVAKVSIAA